MGSLTDAINKLLEGSRQKPHAYKPSIETFAELDAEEIAVRLRLRDQAKANGSSNDDNSGFDAAENAILGFIKAEQQGALATLRNQMQIYDQRLAALDFEERIAVVEGASAEAASEFKVQSGQGLDELHELRRQLVASENWRKSFQQKNGLDRPAVYPEGSTKAFKVGVILILFVVEMFLNGAFLAKGSELGLIGGAAEALGFAALNIFGAAFFAFFGVRQLAHRSLFRKLIGLLSMLAYLAFAVILNLALAHYREIGSAGILLEQASQEVIGRLLTSPFSLAELKSWILFGIGVAFSLAAFVDALGFDDHYPGYGKIERHLRKTRTRYIDAKNEVIENLAQVRDDASEALGGARRDLGVRRSEFDAIAASRQRLIQQFEAHEDHLDVVANRLLSTYRDAYAETAGRRPNRFSKKVKLKRTSLSNEVKPLMDAARLYKAIEDAQEKVSSSVKQINVDYESAVSRLHQLDELTPDEFSNAPKA